jgi:hypothetical protein
MAAVISLDQIVKTMLLKRGYWLHHYIQFLVYAKEGLADICQDIAILPIQYKVLPVNQDGNTVELPGDYQDYIRVSGWVDQYIRPLVEDNNLQLVTNYDSQFQIQPYEDGVAVGQDQLVYYNGYMSPYWWLCNWNSFGENLGRQFGGVGAYADTFRVNRAANQIKINENLSIDNIVLEYASTGTDGDSATHINPYARAAIEAYMLWQHYLHNRTYSSGDAARMEQLYGDEKVKLIARVSDVTIEKLKRIVQSTAIAVKY